MANVHTFDGSNIVTPHIATASQTSTNGSWVNVFTDSVGADSAYFLLDVPTAVTDDIDFKLTQAKDSSGTDAKDISGATITTVTNADGQTLRSIELRPNALDQAILDEDRYTYVRAEVTVANSGTELYGVFLIQHRLRTPGISKQPSVYDEQVIVVG